MIYLHKCFVFRTNSITVCFWCLQILEEKLATERLVARNKLAAKVAEETHKGEAPVDHLAPSFAAYRSKSTADEDDDEDDDSEADAALYDDEDGVASDGDGERQS